MVSPETKIKPATIYDCMKDYFLENRKNKFPLVKMVRKELRPLGFNVFISERDGDIE